MALLIALELLFLYSDWSEAGYFSSALALALPVIAYRQLRLREFYLFGVCTVLIGFAIVLGHPTLAYVREGLERGAYLAAFILLMALLREGAMKSSSILEVGKYLTNQPPNRRFFSVFAGAHYFAVLTNLGALSLFAPIIQRGVRAGLSADADLDEVGQIRERRQICATIRGFSWFLLWAPTAVSQAVMPTLMSGINGLKLIGIGFALAIVMMIVSWAEDMLRWHKTGRRLRAEHKVPDIPYTTLPKGAFLRIGLVSVALFGLSIGFSHAFHVSIVTGVMLTSPIVVALWIYIQQRKETAEPLQASVAQLNTITFENLPNYLREAVFITCAGFIGTLAGKLVPAAELAVAISLDDLPHWFILWCIMASVWVFGQLGLSPITMAVFLGTLVSEIPNLPVDITLMALAIVAGTAVCTSGAPFSAGALMMSRATGYSAFTLTWRWNGPYTLIAMAVLAPIFALLTAL